jgi:hypothetical protein
MIKLILTVDEDTEKEDIIRALHANDAYVCLEEIAGIFRSIKKYHSHRSFELSEEQLKMADMIESNFYDIISDLPAKFT